MAYGYDIYLLNDLFNRIFNEFHPIFYYHIHCNDQMKMIDSVRFIHAIESLEIPNAQISQWTKYFVNEETLKHCNI